MRGREDKEIIILSTCEITNTKLALKTIYSGAFGILCLNNNTENEKKLIHTFSTKIKKAFGIALTHYTNLDYHLPNNVTKIIIPFGYKLKINTKAEILCQVHSLKEAEEVVMQKSYSIVIQGNDGNGEPTQESSYSIFRNIIDKSRKNKVKVYIQDDVGIHTSAAFLALGAHGIIFDSQVALFPECIHPISENKDHTFAEELVANYTNLRNFIFAFFEAAYGHLHQAKNCNIISFDDDSEAIEVEKEEKIDSFSKLSLWERQINKMLQKDKNFSKFSLVFSNDEVDGFFASFVSIMAAPAGIKGIKIKISSSRKGDKNFIEKLQSDTHKLLSGLKENVPVFPDSAPLDIAVVGMECILPSAANKNEYWKNILLAKDCITEIPDSHWNKDKLYQAHTTDTDYSFSKWGGFIPTVDFDPVEFGIVPNSLFMTEPLHLLSLLVVKRALKDAGYENPSECDFENTSIFMGTNGTSNALNSKFNTRFLLLKKTLGEIPDELDEDLPKANEYSFPGILPNILTGRIANRLNFGGRNFTVDAACASSMATLDIACQELSSGHSDMVVLGGADLTNGFPSFLMFSSVHVLSSRSYCTPFDDSADGIIMGEGIGVIILKRLEDAEREGNKIYAVIKGVGGSSNGRNMSIIAPGRKGENRALERAYQNAGVLPSEVGLIEAHGTGTVAGDKIELSTLTDLFVNSGALPKQTFIGSVKSQIGHTKCAAGISGLIKAILSVYYGVIPPTIHIDHLNSFYNPHTSPFVFNRQAGLWNSDKRIAGVSAFGFGGTNYHAIIENYHPNIPEETTFEEWPSELFVFRGSTMDEAIKVIQKTKKLILLNNSVRLADIAYSLALYNNEEVQISIIAGGIDDLLAKLDAVLEDRIEHRIFYRNVKEGKVVFLFSGEGSQYVNMARGLFVAFPSMRRLLDKHGKYLHILFPEAAFDDETQKMQEQAMADPSNALPILGIVDLAIAEFLKYMGIAPDMVSGYSHGKLPALCFSGVFPPDDLVALSEARVKTINDSGEEKGDSTPLVEFTRQIENMYDNGARIFIETGPGRTLLKLVESLLGKKVVTIQTENKGNENICYLLRALGQYLSLGKHFHIENLFEGRNVSFFSIDDPEQYEKSPTGWLINGNEVHPSDKNKLAKASENASILIHNDHFV